MKTKIFNKKILGISALLICSSIIFQHCNNEVCDYTEVSLCSDAEPSGFMVGTMASEINSINPNSVAVLYKTLHNSVAPIGNNWNDPSAGANRVVRIFPANWSSDRIGEVFGIALDHNKGIYLAATDVYKFDNQLPNLAGQKVNWSSGVGSAGSAAIYYTNYDTYNNTIPLVTTLNSSNTNTTGANQIPSTGISTSVGNSLGNIAFDYTHNQLFATNLEDGRIYRIDPTTGKVKSILDPFALDNTLPGISPVGEQVWGIGVNVESGVTKIYFARTTLPHDAGGIGYGGVEIWSVPLNSSGEFSATASSSIGLFTATIASGFIKKEINITNGFQTKVTDIAFSSAGKMLVAERGHPHRAMMFEFNNTGTSWITGNNFYLGFLAAGKNSAGGVDYSNREKNSNFACNDLVWGSGNAMSTQLLPISGSYPNYVYGVQGMSSSGNSSTLSVNAMNDLYIDYNCTGWPHYPNLNDGHDVKGRIGDVEFFDQCSCR